MLPTAALRSNIREIQAMTSQPFAVNLFCRMQEAPTEDELQQPYQPDITLNNVRRQLSIPTPSKYTLRSPPLIDQVQVILEENVKVVSFTFGYLPEDLTQQLWQQGVYIIGTATTVQEALFLAGSSNALRKVDCVVAQGLEAGGHRGSFLPTTKEGDANQQQLSTQELSVAVRQALKDREDIAVVSAGGISSGKEAADYLTKGMDGVVMGTLFYVVYGFIEHQNLIDKLFLTDTQPTRLTRALTGRWARGIPNSLMDTLEKLDDTTIPTYDIHSSRTKDIVNYATEKEIPDYMLLLSGDRHLAGAKYTENGKLSATQLMEKLVKDINAVSS